MNHAWPFFNPRNALWRPLRQALLAPAWLAGAVLLAAPACGAGTPDSAPAGAAGDGCSVLVKLYRSLQDATAVPPAERERLTDRILNACAVVDVELLRASTLDGAAVLEPPVAAVFAPGGQP
jgi:hypothetical protein